MENSPEPIIREMPSPNELAIERNRLASERTLMAWVRTSLSMISFGFTIYKFMQVMIEQESNSAIQPESPRTVGLTLIGLGTFALIGASIQHFNYMRRLLGHGLTYKFWMDLSFVVACFLLLLGVLMFGSIMLKSGPFH